MAEDVGQRPEGTAPRHALQAEAGAAGHERHPEHEGLWRHADHTATHAQASAQAHQAPHQQRARLLQARRGQRRLPCTRSTPARGEVPLLGQRGA